MTNPNASRPVHLDLQKEQGLTVHWADGTKSFYPVAYLRRMSPSADARLLREEMARNPLTVLPASAASGPLTATGAELVGHYAIRIIFSDGHDTGIYSWEYLREIDPALRQREHGHDHGHGGCGGTPGTPGTPGSGGSGGCGGHGQCRQQGPAVAHDHDHDHDPSGAGGGAGQHEP